MINPGCPDVVQRLIATEFPRVLVPESADGCCIVAVSPDMILWLRDGKLLQTWRRKS